MAPLTIAAAAVTVLFWASAFVGIRAGLTAYSPGHLALLRYVIASLVLAGYVGFRRFGLPEKRDLPGILLTGLVGIAVYNVALNAGEVVVAAGPASFIVNSAPVFTALLATGFLKERLNVAGWVGIVVSFGGVAVISLQNKAHLEADRGALLILAAAVALAAFFTLQKHYLTKYAADRLTAYIIWSGTLFLLLYAPGLLPQMRRANLNATLSAVYLGVFPAALAYGTWAYVLSRMKASVAASLLYLVPAVATAIAWLWLGEIPTVWTAVGGGIILAGVFLVNQQGRWHSPKAARSAPGS